MKAEIIEARLRATDIPLEDEKAVPMNGIQKPLPYQVVRKEETVDGDDAGRVRLRRIRWTVALFSANKAPELEQKIVRALAAVGGVAVQSFPDGAPYQTNFEFNTTEKMTGGN